LQLQDPLNTIARKIFSVSQLTDHIKQLLEDHFPMVWITGETSNLRIPSSGHAYFTLKDAKAQISAVMFRGQQRQLKFHLDDGMAIVGLGRISVYAPRGNYQVILEYAEPQGIGALQVAFEQLKQKLENEGLFSDVHKKPLPLLVQRIGVITSPSGAVIQDLLKVIHRRYHNLIIDIYPVRVQGAESAGEIVHALSLANRLNRNDALIIARGGGSLEDLAPFSNEDVARAIFASKIPIVSAVGHETDYTIADFVSDLRAPTPSAAAELVVPVKAELKHRIYIIKQRIERRFLDKCINLRNQLSQANRLLVHPGKKVQEMQVHLDSLTGRLERGSKAFVQEQKNRLHKAITEIYNRNPDKYIKAYRSRLDLNNYKLLKNIKIKSADSSKRLKTVQAVLNAVNPSAILIRGYSITRTLPDLKIVSDAKQLTSGQRLEVQLAKGKVEVSVIKQNVDRKHHGEKKNA
jgi:exodeoxyribonuclease VII large subunit